VVIAAKAAAEAAGTVVPAIAGAAVATGAIRGGISFRRGR